MLQLDLRVLLPPVGHPVVLLVHRGLGHDKVLVRDCVAAASLLSVPDALPLGLLPVAPVVPVAEERQHHHDGEQAEECAHDDADVARRLVPVAAVVFGDGLLLRDADEGLVVGRGRGAIFGVVGNARGFCKRNAH